MPIKFRCRHCRQFLGISRSQAGEITNCPQCGKAIRVPNLDGSVTPIPPPKLNLEDSELANALNELATFEAGGQSPHALEEPSSPHIVVSHPLTSSSPRAKPVEQPVTVIAEPMQSAKPRPSTDDTADEAASAHATHDVLAGLAEAAVSKPMSAGKQTDVRGILRIAIPVGVVLALIVAAVLFFGGEEQQPQSSIATGDKPSVAVDRDAAVEMIANRPAPDHEEVLTGRVTYASDSGDILPDAGAVVMLLPRSRAGEAKLDVSGFLPGSDGVDVEVGSAALRVLGGDIAFADGEGRYELAVPSASDFQLLVISHHHVRDSDQEMETRLQELLSDYFFRPSTLLGQLAFHSEEFRVSGPGITSRDVNFRSE
ncbi:MAG: hypothetical protein KDA93_27160 [Planctomycetaceae bacterium]|nr:hypothetical protein [Planctomycetaceae bacterium]